MKDSPNLDLLRSIAVGLVVLSHLLLILGNGFEPEGYDIHAMGHAGVAIFFVHTTLVLMASLQRHGPAAAPFFIRRFMRIYPLAVTVVLFFGLLKMVSQVPINWPELMSNFLLIQNITGHASVPGPLWSLPYELQMYAVLSALYAITTTRRAVRWTALLCAGAVLVAIALRPESLEFKLLRFVPCFLPGMLAFVLAHRVRAQFSPWVLFAVVGLMAVVAVPVLVAAGLPKIPLLWSLCLALGVAIPFCRELTSAPVAQVAKVVATYSYGVYITHVLSLGVLDGLMPGPAIVQWVSMLILLPGLAYMAYHGIEKRGIALGNRMAAWTTGKRETPHAHDHAGAPVAFRDLGS